MSSIYKPDDHWIHQSLLDVDFYEFTMSAFLDRFYPNVTATLGLTNRTVSVRQADLIDETELRAQLDHARTIRFTPSELYWLRGMDIYGQRMFPETWLESLKDFQLPPYTLRRVNGQFDLQFSGPVRDVTFWEPIALEIISETRHRALLKNHSRFSRQRVYAEGINRLGQMVDAFRERPWLTFVEFGTRRRFGRVWQSDVIRAAAEELPLQFRGTSNCKMAFDYGLTPMGTIAHLVFMTVAALTNSDEELREVPNTVYDQWFAMYGQPLAIFLPDTFGTPFTLRNFGRERAQSLRGLREDSRDPLIAGQQVIDWYRSMDIDPKSKLWLPSDGLTVKKIYDIDDRYGKELNISYCIGTNFSCNLSLPTVSNVVKLITANDRPAVKLSDNRAKAMGPAAEIERYRRVFEYDSDYSATCVV